MLLSDRRAGSTACVRVELIPNSDVRIAERSQPPNRQGLPPKHFDKKCTEHRPQKSLSICLNLCKSADQLRGSGLLDLPSPVLHFDRVSLALTVKNGVIFDLGFLGNVEIVCGKGFHDFNLRFAIREPQFAPG